MTDIGTTVTDNAVKSNTMQVRIERGSHPERTEFQVEGLIEATSDPVRFTTMHGARTLSASRYAHVNAKLLELANQLLPVARIEAGMKHVYVEPSGLVIYKRPELSDDVVEHHVLTALAAFFGTTEESLEVTVRDIRMTAEEFLASSSSSPHWEPLEEEEEG